MRAVAAVFLCRTTRDSLIDGDLTYLETTSGFQMIQKYFEAQTQTSGWFIFTLKLRTWTSGEIHPLNHVEKMAHRRAEAVEASLNFRR